MFDLQCIREDYTVMQDALQQVRGLRNGQASLANKPNAPIAYSYLPGTADARSRDSLLVFLNGLLLPQSGWHRVIAFLLEQGPDAPRPAILTYDRYGQGLSTALDPNDSKTEPGYGHDILEVVRDLHSLIGQVCKLEADQQDTMPRNIIFVANSIGCAIARLYAQTYPGIVAGMILLDSIMANSDFVSLWPDPDAPDFDAEKALQEDVTLEDLREARKKFLERFHPNVINAERLDRRSLRTLLPHADGPRLKGPDEKGPLLLVVGHDPITFAEESFRSMSTPMSLTLRYPDVAWQEYNKRLCSITESCQLVGWVQATGCGHFIQRDDPAFVADITRSLLKDLLQGVRFRYSS